MSKDVLDMLQNMDPAGLERQLAMQCAPLITGHKISNLLMVPESCVPSIRILLQDSDLDYYELYASHQRVSLLLYHKERMEAQLRRPEVIAMLKEYGYCEGSLDDALALLKLRYRERRRSGGEFPHEMGVFLGYDLVDIRGFIEHKGQEFLLSGYWKVYGDVEAKRTLFAAFEHARDTLIKLLHHGVTLTEILDVYRDARDQVPLPA